MPVMTQLRRLSIIGNSLPRRCGIATFTTDLQSAIATSFPELDTAIVAMNDHGQTYGYPATVRIQVRDDRIEDYVHAADLLNAGQFDVVSLQHEFGIFGGEAGSHILTLIERLTMPIVTTLHTVLAEPSPAQRRVTNSIVDASSRVVVMAERARDLLRSVYDVPGDRIDVIPHGIPDAPFAEPDEAKADLGFIGRDVILTFGLLSPNKGIEVMIDAMPAVLKSHSNAVYVVLGATHPNLVREQGEAYRESLVARAQERGVAKHVVFLDRFVDQPTLLRFISMCDVYATPYLNEAQMTSGTLAFSFGLGKAVVSTPYWHARELLADGRGVMVPFGDAGAIGDAVCGLLSEHPRRHAMRERAYALSRSMTWPRTAERYVGAFEAARRGHGLRVIARQDERAGPRDRRIPPAMQIGHFLAMCDDTGILQHAVHSIPDRSHGYCVDDNARALLVACALNNQGEQRLPEPLTARLAAFVQHAWNPDTRRFRNFMSFDRRWLEDMGSEDSHGRTLWALGECARSDANPSRRSWAAGLFAQALPTAESFRSPRAWAFTLLGLDGYGVAVPDDRLARATRDHLADRLVSNMAMVHTVDWVWFEEGLAYDNARLSQALIVTGMATGSTAYVDAGLRSLRWLMTMQTATISACIAAWRADGDLVWRQEVARVFAWFLGDNDLLVPLVDLDTGSCRDGLHPDRANENRGAESVLSYLLSLAEVRQLARMSGEVAVPAALRASA